jgi:hypothetical protein
MVGVLVCLCRDWDRRTRLFVAGGVPASLGYALVVGLPLDLERVGIGRGKWWSLWWLVVVWWKSGEDRLGWPERRC